MSQTPAGWYPDGQGQQRYWDGYQWTEHVAPLEQVERVEEVSYVAQEAAVQETQPYAAGTQEDQPYAATAQGAPGYSVSDGSQTSVYVNAHAPAQGNGLGVTGFVLALLGIFLFWVPFLGWLLWVLGLIFSAIGVFKTPRGLAIAGQSSPS